MEVQQYKGIAVAEDVTGFTISPESRKAPGGAPAAFP